MNSKTQLTIMLRLFLIVVITFVLIILRRQKVAIALHRCTKRIDTPSCNVEEHTGVKPQVLNSDDFSLPDAWRTDHND